MKKIVLTVVAMMTLTMGFAKTDVRRQVRNVENYDMSFDMRRLAAKLDLTDYQMEAVEVIQQCFNNEMLEAATVRGPQRRMMVHQAVRKDAQQMQRVLNDKQFGTYMMLLGTTLHNRGL
ncbi:MAG: hypothetical protein II792_06395 [Prevotella sp.]|nr:hypothetical protein [Prevotella sp.]